MMMKQGPRARVCVCVCLCECVSVCVCVCVCVVALFRPFWWVSLLSESVKTRPPHRHVGVCVLSVSNLQLFFFFGAPPF